MKSDIVAIIPTLGDRLELQPLVSQLSREKIDSLVICRPEINNLHIIWNQGANTAISWGAKYIAIMNDDIKIPVGSLKSMKAAMEKQDFACIGVDPHAGFGLPTKIEIKEVKGNVGVQMTMVTTWFFLLNAKYWQDIDEDYLWWYGVGDLFEKVVNQGGRLGQATGLGIIHVGSGTARNYLWTEDAKLQDAKTWQEKHK